MSGLLRELTWSVREKVTGRRSEPAGLQSLRKLVTEAKEGP